MPKKKLLLHTCCAPCFTSVEERLRDEFDLDVYWYNPNIYPLAEGDRRLSELSQYCRTVRRPLITQTTTNSDLEAWENKVVNYQSDPEGGRRCRECIFFRLSKAAQFARQEGYHLFATTLTVSPHKNSILVNSIGKILQESLEIEYLEADFKKKDGFLRSLELSKEYGLYRQKYCGCRFSLRDSCPYFPYLPTKA